MGAMDGTTETQRNGNGRRDGDAKGATAMEPCVEWTGNGGATQGGGNVTKDDATTSHRSKREVNEKLKAQADMSRASLTSPSGRAIAGTVFGWLLHWFS
jgi:hypothetical protein